MRHVVVSRGHRDTGGTHVVDEGLRPLLEARDRGAGVLEHDDVLRAVRWPTTEQVAHGVVDTVGLSLPTAHDLTVLLQRVNELHIQLGGDVDLPRGVVKLHLRLQGAVHLGAVVLPLKVPVDATRPGLGPLRQCLHQHILDGVAGRTQDAVPWPDQEAETAQIFQSLRVFERPRLHFRLPRPPSARLDVTCRHNGERLGVITSRVLPEVPIVDVHGVVGIQRHDHALDDVAVLAQERGDARGISSRTRHCQRASLMEVLLRVDDEQGDATAGGFLQRHAIQHACGPRPRAEGGAMGAIDAIGARAVSWSVLIAERRQRRAHAGRG
mmetsp:Transcript_87180/g.224522  ORF Transcript_87180/g.224522 Transcript_87180/m.224522 type:complete len:325 (+) Transcript_87180:234-1208(+)